jgi:hypothetical protein
MTRNIYDYPVCNYHCPVSQYDPPGGSYDRPRCAWDLEFFRVRRGGLRIECPSHCERPTDEPNGPTLVSNCPSFHLERCLKKLRSAVTWSAKTARPSGRCMPLDMDTHSASQTGRQ